MQFLQLSLYHITILSKQLDLIVEFSQLIQYFILVLLVHLLQMNYLVTAMLYYEIFYSTEHSAIWTYRTDTLLTKITHLYPMLLTFLFCLLVVVHITQQMLYIIHKSLAVCEIAKQHWLTTVRTFWFWLLNPCTQTVLTSQLWTWRTHTRLLHVLKAYVALQERNILTLNYCLHICYNRMLLNTRLE